MTDGDRASIVVADDETVTGIVVRGLDSDGIISVVAGVVLAATFFDAKVVDSYGSALTLDMVGADRMKGRFEMAKQMTKKSSGSPVSVGQTVLVRTVTHYYTGRIVGVSSEEILLEDAAWIADTGRFHVALRDGRLNEVEPYPEGVVSVAKGAVVDVAAWAHALPREAK